MFGDAPVNLCPLRRHPKPVMRQGLTVLILLVSALLMAGLEPADAQGRRVHFGGRVQWVAGQTMAVQLDSGASVNVDLGGVPQEEYFALSPYERVTVVGVIMDGSRRVTGASIQRDATAQAP
jgi:hypothetical protein